MSLHGVWTPRGRWSALHLLDRAAGAALGARTAGLQRARVLVVFRSLHRPNPPPLPSRPPLPHCRFPPHCLTRLLLIPLPSPPDHGVHRFRLPHDLHAPLQVRVRAACTQGRALIHAHSLRKRCARELCRLPCTPHVARQSTQDELSAAGTADTCCSPSCVPPRYRSPSRAAPTHLLVPPRPPPPAPCPPRSLSAVALNYFASALMFLEAILMIGACQQVSMRVY